MEFVIFVSFVAIQYAAKQLPDVLGHSNHCRSIVDKLSRNHYLVWAAHPSVLHGLHDYAIHFVIYSGYVLHAH